MKSFWSRLFTAAALGCLVALWTLPASAYYPTLQATATFTYNSVHRWVYDPKLNKLQELTSQWGGQDVQVMDKKEDKGVISWVFRNGAAYFVYYSVYDPQLAKFKEKMDGPFASVSQWQVVDGVVAYVVPSTYYPGHEMALYRTYDPLKGWMLEFYDPGDGYDLNMLTKDGLMAFKSTWDTLPPTGPETIVRCDIYDPKLGRWNRGVGGDQWMFIGDISNLSITNATLYFTETYKGQVANWLVGYRPDYQHPYDNPWSNLLPTIPMAWFWSQSDPLWVWFTNMSIAGAGSKWGWNFGDGTGKNEQPSPYHLYPHAGRFTVILDINEGAATYTQTVTVGYGPQAIMLLLME
jgi:hypothetical protein